MIYLSWSVAQLVAYLVVLGTAYSGFMYYGPSHRKMISKVFAVLLALTLFTAFDVGTRQQDLQRSSFDANVPTESVDKVERKTLDREAVKQNFENTVKETN